MAIQTVHSSGKRSWAGFIGLGILAVSVSLGLMSVAIPAGHAKQLYSASPKIPPRTRESGPVLSPLLPQTEAAEATPALPAETPAVSHQTRRDPQAEKPVFYQPEALKPQAPNEDADNLPSQMRPEVMRPEAPPAPQAKPLPKAKKSGKSWQGQEKPIVHFPEEGALQTPETPATQPIAREAAMDETAMAKRKAALMAEQNAHMRPVSFQTVAPSAVRRTVLPEALRHYTKALIYGRHHQVESAMAELHQSISLDPAFADAYVGLSTAAVKKSDWQSVMENARKALTLDSFLEPANRTEAQFNLSAAYCVADDWSTARKYYDLAKAGRHPRLKKLDAYLHANCSP